MTASPAVPALARAESLIDSMQRLAEMFRHETELLRKRDSAAVRALADSKHRLVRSYEDSARTVRQDAAGFATLDEATKERLKTTALAFRAAAEENASIVRAATLVTQSLVNTMVGTINRERAQESGYTARSGVAIPAGYMRRTTPAASLNRVY